MLNEKNKASRIMKEITNYYFDHGFYTFDIHFNATDTYFEMEIKTQADQEPKSFHQLIDDLNTPREIEVDEYYNCLLGSHTHHEDYTFLGKSIDEAVGTFENNTLTLYIKRYFI